LEAMAVVEGRRLDDIWQVQTRLLRHQVRRVRLAAEFPWPFSSQNAVQSTPSAAAICRATSLA
jgi:hypothetical protein